MRASRDQPLYKYPGRNSAFCSTPNSQHRAPDTHCVHGLLCYEIMFVPQSYCFLSLQRLMGKYKRIGLLERRFLWGTGTGWHQPETGLTSNSSQPLLLELIFYWWLERRGRVHANHSRRLGCDPSHNLAIYKCPSQWMPQVTLDQSSILCFAVFKFKLFFCLQSLNLTLLIMKLSEILLNLEFRNYKPLQSADIFFLQDNF